ncbi:hypothetical protein [Coraliomargarita parva]|uniref:hypothetical protein n=1 Tax=Coraliomargarita parva TaxID=3014050 RepID=UPI0022B48D09|nr:hypothetical protein [Coraliomargarita parva]
MMYNASPLEYHEQDAPARRREGFALIVAIMLMSFMVLLLVTIASMVKVESTVSQSASYHASAQNNALLAMQIAIGELQKYAGPDQRVSTTADLLAETDINGNATPAPLYTATTPRMTVTPGTRYWTGIWGNEQPKIGYEISPDDMPTANGNVRGITPALMTWLISGNEGAAYSLSGNNGGVTVGDDGAGNPQVNYSPAAAVNLSDPSNPTVAGQPAVMLVGGGSALDTNRDNQEYVVAPLVDIDGTGGSPSGRYAWWVGDEGVKARVDLQNGYLKSADPDDEIKSFIISQRSGVEFLEGVLNGTYIGSDYDLNSDTISRITWLDGLPLTLTDTAAQDRLKTIASRHFHNLTANSFGVLADTYAGGLKKDLTSDIADTSPNFSYRPDDSDPIFTPISTGEEHLPTWGHLRTWARTHPDADGAITPQVASDTNAGLGPVLLLASIGFDIRVAPSGELNVLLFPTMALCNPYPVAIKAEDYQLGFRFSEGAIFEVATAKKEIDPVTGEPKDSEDEYIDLTTKCYINWAKNRIETTADVTSDGDIIYFNIEGLEIPPGETHVYELSTTGAEYSNGLTMVRGKDDEEVTALNFCKMPGSVILDPDNVDYYMYVNGRTKINEVNYVWDFSYSRGSPKADVILALDQGSGILDEENYISYTKDIYCATYGPGNWRQIINVLGQTDEVVDPVTGDVIDPATDIGPYTMPFKYANLRLKTTDEDIWWDVTTGPRMALRYGNAGEGRGGTYSDPNLIGLPYHARAWLRHGNFRAPFGTSTMSELGESHYNNTACRGNGIYGFVLASEWALKYGDVNIYPSVNEYALSMTSSPSATSPALLGVYFDVLKDSERLLSIGQFQHVPFARYTHNTTYPFANSYGEYRLDRRTSYRANNVPRFDDGGDDTLYDLSYHLNRSMWDKYFLSTVPMDYSQSDLDSGKAMHNSRLVPFADSPAGSLQLDDIKYISGGNAAYDKAAANLLNAGAFNVNSTSEEAWRAVLAGTYDIPSNEDFAVAGDEVGEIIPFSRFSSSLVDTSHSGGPYLDYTVTMTLDTGGSRGFDEQYYYGNRGLYLNNPDDTTQNDNVNSLVNELARTMVEQVRLRGPFLSLSDFVNRSLTDNDSDPEGIKGALQSAIDRMKSSSANPHELWTSIKGGNMKMPPLKYNGKTKWFDDYDEEMFIGGSAEDITSIPESASYTALYANGPKYLTQADVLSTIGPALSPRSDSFKIRAYGETVDPVSQSVIAHVWCEAIVQRIPEFVDDQNSPETALNDPNISGTNLKFGRKFKIVKFRWLDDSEI